MLREVRHVRQVPDDYLRRWFTDEDFDLIIWYKPDRAFHGFQLCYDLAGHAKALTWTEDRGFSHHGLDTGDESPLANRAPILLPNSHFDAAVVYPRFRSSDQLLPAKIRDFVRKKIEAYELKS